MNLSFRSGAAIVLALCLGAGVAAQEAKKPAKKAAGEKAEKTATKIGAAKATLPPPISQAFAKAYPKARITGTSKETQGGKTVYEVESTDQGMSRDLIYNPDGTVVEVEEGMNPADLPVPVAEALKKAYPTATITKAEKLTRGETVQYELALSGGKQKSATITPEGKLLPPGKPELKKPASKMPKKFQP